MRTFVAVELPGGVKERLSGLVERLRECGARATWVKPEAMHLTLRFLGDLDTGQVEALRAELREGYAGKRAFTLKVEGVGAFPNLRRPNVIWAGVSPLEGPLAEAQSVAETAARAIGLPAETKAFHPHLTLARIKDPTQGRLLGPAAETEAGFYGGEFDVPGVVLFSSRLTPQGAVHERVEEYPLT